jgi:hypothetical protein
MFNKLSPLDDNVDVSMALSLIPEEHYPVECCECSVTLRSSVEGACHQALTGHSDGWHRLGREQADEVALLRDAGKQWESAECTGCPARFATQQEAAQHDSIRHSVIHTYGRRAVN